MISLSLLGLSYNGMRLVLTAMQKKQALGAHGLLVSMTAGHSVGQSAEQQSTCMQVNRHRSSPTRGTEHKHKCRERHHRHLNKAISVAPQKQCCCAALGSSLQRKTLRCAGSGGAGAQ